jgi:hypothetical protein
MKTFLAPPVVYRVGRAGSSLELAPWTLAPFSGRFDDPAQEYRVRYVGISRRGALIERLAKYRPDLDAIAAINEVESDSPPLVPNLPLAWLDDNEIATAAVDVPLDNGIVDLTSGEGMALAHAAIEVARRRTGRALADYDASVLMSATPREFTQAISRYIFEAGFAGVAYLSRFAPEEICLALFEDRHSLHDASVAAIASGDVDLADALGLHHLAFETPVVAVEQRESRVVGSRRDSDAVASQPTEAMPEAPAVRSLRQEVHDLVYRVRELAASVGPNPSEDDEADVTLAYGTTGLSDEVHDAKVRIRNFTGQQHPDMQALTRIVPVGPEQLLQVANLLERLAGAIPSEARATPRALRKSGDRLEPDGNLSMVAVTGLPLSSVPNEPRRVAFMEYGNAYNDTRGHDAGSYAMKMLAEAPTPANFREELLQFAYDLKRLLKHYHGSLTVDSMVDPEISRAISHRIRETRHRVRTILQRNPFSKETELPVTVMRVARFASNLEAAARLIPESERPSVF